MTSLTLEMYGALSTTLLIFIIYKHYQNHLNLINNNKRITIWIDNTETITRATVEKERMNVSEMMVPEYDLKNFHGMFKVYFP